MIMSIRLWRARRWSRPSIQLVHKTVTTMSPGILGQLYNLMVASYLSRDWKLCKGVTICFPKRAWQMLKFGASTKSQPQTVLVAPHRLSKSTPGEGTASIKRSASKFTIGRCLLLEEKTSSHDYDTLFIQATLSNWTKSTQFQLI